MQATPMILKPRQNVSSLPRWWAFLSMVLMVATWQLWFGDSFPTIPLVQLLTITAPLIYLPSATLLGALLLIVISPQRFYWAWWLVAGSLLASFLLDQHRLQPWAYQLAIYGVIFASLRGLPTQRVLIPLVASIYLYSACGKFDYQFAHTVGQDFLSALLAPGGGFPEQINLEMRAKIALMFPAAEGMLGVGLLFSATRRIAGTMAMGMHAGLIALLGPWSLDHSLGVLLWNLALLVQAHWLMVKKEDLGSATEEPVQSAEPVPIHVWALVVAAIVAPFSERWGYWDHWPSWALYAPHTSRVEVEIHRSGVEKLDPTLQAFVVEGNDGWHRLAMDRWSLHERGAPLYPQARYQLAMAIHLAERYELADEIRARLRGTSDRWTGQRATQRMLGYQEIKRGMEQFWLR